MSLGTIIGLGGAAFMMVFGVLSSGGSILSYADLPSVLIVVGGTIFALMAFAGSIPGGIEVFKTFGLTFKEAKFDSKSLIQKLLSFSEKARREGLLALEEELEDLDDEFLKKGMRLVVDGTDGNIIRDLLELEVSQIQARHSAKIAGVNMFGALAPAFGMLGTVIGLIAMLGNLEDRSALGPNMAVALITTLYGAMMANIIAIPLSGKLKVMDDEEVSLKEMEIEGILSIQAGENSRVLEVKLLSYVEPGARKALESEK